MFNIKYYTTINHIIIGPTHISHITYIPKVIVIMQIIQDICNKNNEFIN